MRRLLVQIVVAWVNQASPTSYPVPTAPAPPPPPVIPTSATYYPSSRLTTPPTLRCRGYNDDGATMQQVQRRRRNGECIDDEGPVTTQLRVQRRGRHDAAGTTRTPRRCGYNDEDATTLRVQRRGRHDAAGTMTADSTTMPRCYARRCNGCEKASTRDAQWARYTSMGTAKVRPTTHLIRQFEVTPSTFALSPTTISAPSTRQWSLVPVVNASMTGASIKPQRRCCGYNDHAGSSSRCSDDDATTPMQRWVHRCHDASDGCNNDDTTTRWVQRRVQRRQRHDTHDDAGATTGDAGATTGDAGATTTLMQRWEHRCHDAADATRKP
ncbi:hypothetical protein BDZ97DRAFT_1752246 [Flammula alnicola]|nr:hypothetical protein BDZ97DRAFT_1752246 [Flammula alnicola]